MAHKLEEFINYLYLGIEPTNACNLNCIMCRGNARSSTFKFLTLNIFQKLINNIIEFPVSDIEIALHLDGEPLLNPDFHKFIPILKQLISKNPEIKVFFSTNGHFLDEKLARTFIESGVLDRIWFSIDAVSPATYSKIRRNGNYFKVIKNIKNLLKLRKYYNKKKPFILLQFIVMEENYNETEEFIRFWNNIFERKLRIEFDWNVEAYVDDTIFIVKRLYDSDRERALYFETLHLNKIKELGLIKDDKSERHLRSWEHLKQHEMRMPCPAPFSMLVIHADGKVSPCCTDTSGKLIVGDVCYQDLYNIFYSEQMDSLRKAHLTGNLSDFPVCNKCLNQSATCFDEKFIKHMKKVYKI